MSLVNKHIGCGLAVCLSALLLLQGCADDDMVQLDMQEPETLSAYDYLKDYGVLKSYNDHIGVIMDASDLTGGGMESRIAVSNFAEIAPGGMYSHASVIKANGNIDSTTIVAVRKSVAGKDLTLLGTPLVWHRQQNVTYLSSQLEPNIIRPDGDEGGYALKMTNTAIGGSVTSEQVAHTFARTPRVEPGIMYKLKMWIRGTNAGSIRIEAYSNGRGSRFSPEITVTSDWTYVETFTTIATGVTGLTSILFDLGGYVGTVYVDDIELKEWNANRQREVGRNLNTVNTNLDDAEATANSMSIQTDENGSLEDVGCSALGEGYDPLATYVEKTDEEKSAILTAEMQRYIDGVMGAAGGSTSDWIVVKEPLATDDGDATCFYWQSYLGGTGYAVTALAEAARHTTGKLYVEESGLDTDLDKCSRFTSYVTSLESQGAKVDGLAVTIDAYVDSTSTANVGQMLQWLAATGKMVRISDLNVTISGATSDNVTEAQLKKQAEMYGDIIKAYNDNVPEAQRGGITIHQTLDNGTPNGLWNRSYSRKHAYGSVAEALK